MDKATFQKEMRDLAEDRFEWAEECEDCFVWTSENDYVAIELVDDGTFAVECENGYVKTFKDIDRAKEDVLELIAAICEQQL